MAAIYLGHIDADPGVQAKIRQKHQIGLNDIREALQWPARARAAPEDHPEHGWRVVALGTTADGRELIAALLPVPTWAGELAESWLVKTARWVK